MELSSQDCLRLNVLLANRPQAIRIDESKMIVHGLSERGEAKVALNPTGPADRYVRKVKELISGQVLGSPGGYPIYLKRWTRMGQMRDQSLEQLLMLGEPEAVVAAVCSPGLTDELARRAWWAMEDAANARRMLSNPLVVQGEMGPVLARYLVDYLPFEADDENVVETVRLVLQPGLVESAQVAELWKKSARKPAYVVGFLKARGDALPELAPPRSDLAHADETLSDLIDAGNTCAGLLRRLLTAEGQSFLKAVETILKKPPTTEMVNTGMEILRDYLAALRPAGEPGLDWDRLAADAATAIDRDAYPGVSECAARVPGHRRDIESMILLSGLGYAVIYPLMRDSTASGSLMRRKLSPMLEPVLDRIRLLRTANNLGGDADT